MFSLHGGLLTNAMYHHGETVYYKSSLGAIFVQTCSLTSIYNGMYTACSYDTVRLIELET